MTVIKFEVSPTSRKRLDDLSEILMLSDLTTDGQRWSDEQIIHFTLMKLHDDFTKNKKPNTGE
ncbi:hypothetical protein [Halalkalibacter sp. APA_J-10(15)]|uniref:hypothetical protein n=1 Tax=Halalkalibacter sp. APA_J-10(15) TaxID=2933805 RepID=UPI001FF1C358|nr:hypothetical protein [Halalkalibacter sp. APA_J-10(15)]MCK0472518.1 hypothetical protein [Halalkalibacter sp. APA_J-10(15)]